MKKTNNKKEKTIDFDNSFLPSNRKDQFKNIFRHNVVKIISIGASILLFALPSLVTSFIKMIFLANAYSNYDENNLEEFLINLRSINIIFDGIQILALIVLSLGVAGAMKIIKSLCYDEIYFFKSDFIKGIKENGKQYAIISLFFSILIFFYNFLSVTSNLSSDNTLKVGLIIFIGLFMFGIVPILTMMISSICIYKNSFGNHFKNCFILVMKHYFPYVFISLLFSLGIIGLYLFENLVSNGGLYAPIAGIVILYLFPLILIINHLYSLSLFDKYINSQYPEIYRKGLSLNSTIESINKD